jgi:formylglycine-generating enzyme required for sulfatase activity
MSALEGLLAGIVEEPSSEVRWNILADWVEEFEDSGRAELLRIHRRMLATCTEPSGHPEREVWHGQMMDLMGGGVAPYSLYYNFQLPGSVPISFAFIPPGSFLMGSPESERLRGLGEFQHLVTITRRYALSIYPVTQAQWVALMGENPSQRKGKSLPVESVSWDDATVFCRKLSELTGFTMRLPTEAEWEHAARAGTTTPYYWVGEADGTQANFWGQDPGGPDPVGDYPGWTTPVGSYAAIAPHPWGLADLLGNVLEWCADWFDPLPSRRPAMPRSRPRAFETRGVLAKRSAGRADCGPRWFDARHSRQGPRFPGCR